MRRMRTSQLCKRAASAGFTLMELLVVIVIIVLLLSVSIPGITGIVRSQRVKSAVDAISSVVRAARAESSIPPEFRTGDFGGAAVIFTPGGELRIVKHFDSLNFVGQDGQRLESKYKAYQDAGQNYTTLNADVGIVGISRVNAEQKPTLLAPPFAVRYNRHGNQISGGDPVRDADALVYYNGNYDRTNHPETRKLADRIQIERSRQQPGGGGAYNPERWDPSTDAYIEDAKDGPETLDQAGRLLSTTGNHPMEGRVKLPFDRYESVVGLLVYDKKDLKRTRQLSLKSTGGLGQLDDATTEWLLENGQVIFFNRYTGAAVK